jgi:hypothetical protein
LRTIMLIVHNGLDFNSTANLNKLLYKSVKLPDRIRLREQKT